VVRVTPRGDAPRGQLYYTHAPKTLKGLIWFEVLQQTPHIADGNIVKSRATVRIGCNGLEHQGAAQKNLYSLKKFL